MHVPVCVIIRARTKSFKDALDGLIQWIRVEPNMMQYKMGPKEDLELVNVIKKLFNLPILEG